MFPARNEARHLARKRPQFRAAPIGPALPGSKLRASKFAMALAIVVGLTSITMARAEERATCGEAKVDVARPAIVKDAIDAAEWMAKRQFDPGRAEYGEVLNPRSKKRSEYW